MYPWGNLVQRFSLLLISLKSIASIIVFVDPSVWRNKPTFAKKNLKTVSLKWVQEALHMNEPTRHSPTMSESWFLSLWLGNIFQFHKSKFSHYLPVHISQTHICQTPHELFVSGTPCVPLIPFSEHSSTTFLWTTPLVLFYSIDYTILNLGLEISCQSFPIGSKVFKSVGNYSTHPPGDWCTDLFLC